MLYAIYNAKGELISTASEIDEAVIQEKKLSYKTYNEDPDWETKDWDTQTQDFKVRPEPPIKDKAAIIAEVVAELGLTKEQEQKLKELNVI